MIKLSLILVIFIVSSCSIPKKKIVGNWVWSRDTIARNFTTEKFPVSICDSFGYTKYSFSKDLKYEIDMGCVT